MRGIISFLFLINKSKFFAKGSLRLINSSILFFETLSAYQTKSPAIKVILPFQIIEGEECSEV